MSARLDDGALAQLFLNARTSSVWLDRPVGDAVLHELYALMRMAPTSANCAPARIVFVRSAEGRERLRPALSAGNVDKTMSAPVTAIVGYDRRFYERLPQLFPLRDLRPMFTADAALAESTAFRNSSLQGAYLLMAARALGLDCGPMSGFDQAAMDREFFPHGEVTTNFLCNLGYGDHAAWFPRLPRLDFNDACTLC